MSLSRTVINNGRNFKSFPLLTERCKPKPIIVPLRSSLATPTIQFRNLLSTSTICSSDKSKSDPENGKKDSKNESKKASETTGEPKPSVAIAIGTEAHLFGKKQKHTDGRPARVIPRESEGEEEKKRHLAKAAEPPNIAPPTIVLLRPMYIPPMHEMPTTEEELIPPTNCCMSGCSNCVWIDYVEKLTELYSNPALGKERVHRDINSIDDPNIKAWLIMDLSWKGLW